MYFLPFLYFAGLTYYFWQKNKTFDLAVYISLLFTITSLCGVIMVLGGFLMKGSGVLANGWEPNFGVVPTFLYCALITLTIIPFSFVRVEKLKTISNLHRYLIISFALFITLQGVVVYFLIGDSIMDLLNGDFKYLKDAAYGGEISPADVKMLTMPLPIQLLYLTCFMTLLGVPLFFYYVCVEKVNIWLCVPLLFVSISPILRGVLSADRTEIIHYGLMFLFSVVLFQNFITKKIRSFLLYLSVPVAFLSVFYVFAVSASRFEDTEEGTHGSMIEYAGQSYANFCYVYENHNPDLFYVEREIPLISYLFFNCQYVDTKDERSAKEGFFIGVFVSHIGSWFLDVGLVGCIFLSVAFFILCCLLIKRYNRTELDIAEVFMIFILGAVPTFGVFYYRYYSIATAFIYVAGGFIYLFSKVKIVWKTDKETLSKPINPIHS